MLSKCGRQLFPDGTVAICLFNNSRNLVEAFVSWGATEFVTEMFAPNPCWSLRKNKPHCKRRLEDGAIFANRNTGNVKAYLCTPMTAFGDTIRIMMREGRHAHAAADDVADFAPL